MVQERLGSKGDRKTPFAKMRMRCANCIKIAKGGHSDEPERREQSITHEMELQIPYSLCPERRKVFYHEKREAVGKILRQLCDWKGVRIIQAEVCPDRVDMLLEIPSKYSVSSFIEFLKEKSSLMLYERFPELKYKYRNREFWSRGYHVDTAGKNAKRIAEYIKNQLDEDRSVEQMTMGNI